MVTGSEPEGEVAAVPAGVDRRTATLMRSATYASVSVASVLIAAKLVAWLMTDSVAVLSSLVDSILDAAASIVNLLAVRHALTPADREHRFGHGKAEALAGLGQAAFIAGSAVFLLFQAGERLIHPRPPMQGAVGIVVIAVSIVLTLALVAYQGYVVRRTGSVAISADSLHYRGDLLMNLAVILALVLGLQFGWRLADPLFALAIAAYILYGAYEIFRASRDQLMDRELPEEQRRKIRDIVTAHPEVLAMHDLRTRSSGINTFIQLHLEMDGQITLYTAHEISETVEAELRAAFPEAEVIIHEDPYGIDEPRASFRG